MGSKMKNLLLSVATCFIATAASADMSAALLAPWDGVKVPDGQQCTLHGGNGATPPINLSGVPDGTAHIVLFFNDKSYAPLSRNGGHGAIAFAASGGNVSLASVPALTANLPNGVSVYSAARSTGNYASAGYLPPCSGGRGNRYTVDIKAVSAEGTVLDELLNFDIGRY